MKQQEQLSGFGVLLLTGLLVYIQQLCPPLMVDEVFQWQTVIVDFLLFLSANRLAIITLNQLAGWLEYIDAHSARGHTGTSQFANFKKIKRELSRAKSSPFWGRMADKSKKVLRADFVSSAFTVAPAGSGKGIYAVVPNIIAIMCSKIIIDFKGELSAMLVKLLRNRGENVRIINAGGLFTDILGQSDCYNPLDIINDDLFTAGGLRDVINDLKEMSMQFLPEPAGKSSENTYFRNGSRNLIGLSIIIQCMIEGYEANLKTCALLLENRQSLEHHLRWIVGVDLEEKPLPEGAMPIEATEWAQVHETEDVEEFVVLIRARAANCLKMMTGQDNRTFESFIAGAQQALSGFTFGRISEVMNHSTFSMNDLKDENKVTTLFIVADASRIEAYKPFLGLIQWCAFTAIKRHPNKHVPVYAILDEATNYLIQGLTSLLTWGRGYGLRLYLIFQDFTAFERVYGKDSVETLLSETEIKQFLPSQRSPKTLDMIEKLLGKQGVMGQSFAENNEQGGTRQSMSEAARPLMTADEIRRSQNGILFIRQSLPVLFEPISYAEISPWRKQVGINPFHGKPFLKRTKVRL